MIQISVSDISKHSFPEPVQLRYNCFMHEQLGSVPEPLANLPEGWFSVNRTRGSATALPLF